MARFPLASNSDWELTNDEQDIRGWEAQDSDGNRLGEVTQMLMNTETQKVEVIRLDNGRELATADVYLGKGIVYCDVEDVGKLPVAVTELQGDGHIARRFVQPDPAFTSYEPAFRSHHGNIYATTGWVYEFYQPGYRLGVTLASNGANADKTYEQVEPRAKEDFIGRHGGAEYGGHREAIRYGYEHHREHLLKSRV